jgi:hypothetical protein
MTKLITIVILVIGTVVYFGSYEVFNLLYYQEDKADYYATFGLIPLLLYFPIALFYDKYTFSIKDNRVMDALKYSLEGVCFIVIVYYFIMVPVISGAILWSNDMFGPNEKIIVRGYVVDKYMSDGPKLSEYRLTVKASGVITTWNTNKIEASKFKYGDPFSMEMRKGYWGLLSKEK